ncbi:YciI family protein [Christiangramia aquimixticola]|uniref:YciI family protein n=1 Tax=Christiangramia aquimixticola TaxID=1697558 RepID=UPI003AA7F77E
MRKLIFLFIFPAFISCMQSSKENSSAAEEKASMDTVPELANNAQIEADLKRKGYKTFSYKSGDTTYLMQEYYMVFLKSGNNRSQDSTEAVQLQKKHLEYLSWLSKEGYTSLTGPMGDDGELRGIVVYNTATAKEADSLANLDPMVKAGRLKVEVHPWWVAKGGKLK